MALVTKSLHQGFQGSLRPLGPFLHPRRQRQNLAVGLYPDTLGALSPSVEDQMVSHLKTMGPSFTVIGLIALWLDPISHVIEGRLQGRQVPWGPWPLSHTSQVIGQGLD